MSDESSEFKGLRTALITELLLPPDNCEPVAPIGPNLRSNRQLVFCVSPFLSKIK